VPLEDFTFSPLTPDFDVSNFDCGNSDINEFLREDALNYQNQFLANTFVFYKDTSTVVAFFCISNDCLNKELENRIWNRFHRKQNIPNDKRIRQYPAIKIGRLGVDSNYQKSGIAYELMDFIKGFSVLDLKPACRLLLLDAYNQPRQLQYYNNNEFAFLHEEDQAEPTRIMYFDLKKFD
jgi:GNAT superfamily N-acetyltransferase